MAYEAVLVLFLYVYAVFVLWWRRYKRKETFHPTNVYENTRPNGHEEYLDSLKLTANNNEYEFDEICFAFSSSENCRICGQILSTLDPLQPRVISRLGCLSIDTGDGNIFVMPSYPEMSQEVHVAKDSEDETELKSFGLTYRVSMALKKVHIQFSGMMRRTSGSDLHHLKFSLVFTEITRPFISTCDSSPWVYAEGVLKHGKTKYRHLWDSMESFDQWGQAVGTLYQGDLVPKQLIMRGVRSHSFGKIPFNFGRQTVAISETHVYLKDGHVLSIKHDSRLPKPIGYCIQPYIHFDNLISYNSDKLHLSEDRFDCPNYSLQLAGSYHSQWTSSAGDLPEIEIRFAKVFDNQVEVGWAVSRNTSVPMSLRSMKVPTTHHQLIKIHHHLTSEHNNVKCCNIHTDFALCLPLVGGKAIQLAVLSQAGAKEFSVPKAVVVTTKAYQSFLQDNDDIRSALDRILETCSGGITSAIKVQCEAASNKLERTGLSARLKAVLSDELMRHFGPQWTSVCYAVRSSSVGEDGTTLSSAGQMQTILNVTDIEKVCSAVVKCWASGCSFPVVDYRRTHGQLPLSPMAVIVQEMVHPDAAGVMFTCDPVSGNPSKIVITAVRGLGEAVVDGSVTPDTFVVRRNGQTLADLISTNTNSNNNNSNNHKLSGCLSTKLSLQLAAIGVQTEKIFGSPRDIEWALRDGRFYMLQVMLHLMRGGKWTSGTFGFWKRPVGLLTRAGFPIIQNYVQLDLLTLYSHIGASNRHVVDLCLLGHPYNDDFIDRVVVERTDPSWIQAFWGRLDAIQALKPILSQSFLHGIEKGSNQMALVDLDCSRVKTSAEVFQMIIDYLPTMFTAAALHGDVSAGAMIYYNVMMSLITNNSEDWTSENYCDVATLLSSCTEVVSAEVPNQIRLLAKCIADSPMAKSFLSLSPQEAVDWLNTVDSGECGVRFAQFLRDNGHRTINEMEVRVAGWGADPKSLISLLQNLVKEPKSLEYTKVTIGVKEAIDQLKVKLPFFKRWVLGKLLPRARYAVGLREKTKSNLVRCVDQLKFGLRTLAKLLYRIPDEDLLFFFTISELHELTIDNKPLIVSRANRRRRIYPRLKQFQFPEVSIGFPLAVQEVSDQVHSVFELYGTPVCKGTVKGTARVVTTVADAHEIKHGDILITVFTDIGWTPYFALLSGVVTELGGILSHGAVVAREYGIPCLVNVKTATSVFQSGDTVLLDAVNGVLKKID